MSKKPSSTRGLDKYVSAAELARSLGVSPETVVAYARRRPRMLRKVAGRNYLHLDLADAYISRLGLERRAQRPSGWKTLKAVLAESGAGRSTVFKAIEGEELRAVLARATVYVHPEDAERFVQAWKNLKPLPGWVMVAALHKELGRSKEALNQWIRRNRESVEVRKFLHPRCNRPTPYIREADAERYRAIVKGGSEKHVGYTFVSSESSRNRVLEAVAKRKGQPVSAAALAEELELPEETCKRIAKRLSTEGALRRSGRGTAYHPYRYVVLPSASKVEDG